MWRRRVFGIFAAVFMMLTISVGVAWAGSYRYWIWVERVWGGSGFGSVHDHCSADVIHGKIVLGRSTVLHNAWNWHLPTGWHYRLTSLKGGTINLGRQSPSVFGFRWHRYRHSWSNMGASLTLPLWAPFFATAVCTTAFVSRFRYYGRRMKRRRRGSCEQCGYDLRGSPERCPECGLVAEHDLTAKDAEVAEKAATGF